MPINFDHTMCVNVYVHARIFSIHDVFLSISMYAYYMNGEKVIV